MQYSEMSKEQLLQLKAELDERYKEAKAKGLNLNMSRGKPSPSQLNVTMDMLDVINSSSDFKAEDGTDCRNYGVLDGLTEAKKLMADMMGTTSEHIIIYGNASLNIMYDQVSIISISGPFSVIGILIISIPKLSVIAKCLS